MEFFKSNSRIAFMGTRKIWYAVSAILFITSLAALFTKGLNLGVDFTGGITVEAKFTGEAKPEELRTGLERAGFEDVQVQNSIPPSPSVGSRWSGRKWAPSCATRRWWRSSPR